MKRIGITQRVAFLPERKETRDCLDQRLVALVARLGFLPLPLSNALSDIPAYLTELALDGVVLSGGNDLAVMAGGTGAWPERDRLEGQVIDYCSRRGLPVFGICRGLQMLNHHFGGRLLACGSHIAVPHRVASLPAAPAHWPKSFMVNSYHGWVIPRDALSSKLVPLAYADDGTVEAARHSTLRIFGVMWHPERDSPTTDRDEDLMRGFLEGHDP